MVLEVYEQGRVFIDNSCFGVHMRRGNILQFIIRINILVEEETTETEWINIV